MNLLQALPLTSLAALAATASCTMDRAPDGLRRTPAGPGATVRFDLSHRPLPDIPLPNDTATWPDPTSRTGLRVNASLVAPTSIEAQARSRFGSTSKPSPTNAEQQGSPSNARFARRLAVARVGPTMQPLQAGRGGR